MGSIRSASVALSAKQHARKRVQRVGLAQWLTHTICSEHHALSATYLAEQPPTTGNKRIVIPPDVAFRRATHASYVRAVHGAAGRQSGIRAELTTHMQHARALSTRRQRPANATTTQSISSFQMSPPGQAARVEPNMVPARGGLYRAGYQLD